MKATTKRKQPARMPLPLPFLVFVCFITLFLPVFHLQGAQDQTKTPQLLALCLFLLCFGLYFLRPGRFSGLDLSVLRHALFPVLAGYFAITALSMAFAFNWRESLYDIVKSFVFLSLVALGAMLFLQTDRWKEILVKCIFGTAIIACAVGYGQYISRVLMPQAENGGNPSVYSVVGLMSHKNLFSLSLMMIIPFIIYGIRTMKEERKWIPVTLLSLDLLLILLLKTRAVWMALLISVPATMLILVFFRRKFDISARGRNYLAAGVAAIFLMYGAIFGSAFHSREHSPGRYLASMVNYRDSLNTDRLKVWSLTAEMIRDHFFTGVGAGNWQIHSQEYYRDRFSGDDELNWMRPHNDYLWVMSEKGIVGLILFLLIFIVTTGYCFHILVKSPPDDRVFALLLLGGLTAYLVASFFDFPGERPLHQALLSLYLVPAVVMFHRLKPGKPLKIARPAILIPFLLLAVFGTCYSYSAVRQEIYVNKAIRWMKQGEWKAMLADLGEAESPLKNMDQLANPIPAYAGNAYMNLQDFPSALKAYQEAYRIYPDYINSIMNLSYVNIKLKNFGESERMLLDGLKQFPNCKKILKYLTEVYYFRGDYIKSYLTYRAIPGWKEDSLINANLSFLESRMGIADPDYRKTMPAEFDRYGSVSYYTSRIMEDPGWLKLVRQKSMAKGKSLQEMIRLDAGFMTDRQIGYYQSRILMDSAWVKNVRKKAAREKKTFREMVRLDAEYIVNQRIGHYRSKMENDTAELRKVMQKAISAKKGLYTTLDAEAREKVDNEIMTGKER